MRSCWDFEGCLVAALVSCFHLFFATSSFGNGSLSLSHFKELSLNSIPFFGT